ncbi:MAG: hypothetical protein F6K45_17800 [Kamptonema sp. SIO1D9]|nr:hypothetical protein [Kamptonema sp. SIO1D9]
MLNLLENISILDKIFIFAILIGFLMLAFSLLINPKIVANLKSEKVPKPLQNFPVHQTNPDSYLATKSKLDRFLDLLVADEENIELQLNQSDLNNLYTKGIQIDKYKPGRYFYYSIQEKFIRELMLEWPVIIGLTSFKTREKTIYFEDLNQRNQVVYSSKMIKDVVSTIPLSKSGLMLFLFGASRSPALVPNKSSANVEYQRAIILINKLKSVEIKNHYLILKA